VVIQLACRQLALERTNTFFTFGCSTCRSATSDFRSLGPTVLLRGGNPRHFPVLSAGVGYGWGSNVATSSCPDYDPGCLHSPSYLLLLLRRGRRFWPLRFSGRGLAVSSRDPWFRSSDWSASSLRCFLWVWLACRPGVNVEHHDRAGDWFRLWTDPSALEPVVQKAPGERSSVTLRARAGITERMTTHERAA